MLTKKVVSVYLSASPLSASLPSNSIRRNYKQYRKAWLKNSYQQSPVILSEFPGHRIPQNSQSLSNFMKAGESSRVVLLFLSEKYEVYRVFWSGLLFLCNHIAFHCQFAQVRSVKCLTSVPSKLASR